jgi:hypothetical protein
MCWSRRTRCSSSPTRSVEAYVAPGAGLLEQVVRLGPVSGHAVAVLDLEGQLVAAVGKPCRCRRARTASPPGRRPWGCPGLRSGAAGRGSGVLQQAALASLGEEPPSWRA